MIDFRSCLSDVLSYEAEEKFRLFLLHTVGLSLTPGSACHHPVPGFFRMCYAFVDYRSVSVLVCLRFSTEYSISI